MTGWRQVPLSGIKKLTNLLMRCSVMGFHYSQDISMIRIARAIAGDLLTLQHNSYVLCTPNKLVMS